MATLAEVLRQAGYVTPQGQVTGPRTDLAQKLKSYVMNIPQNAAQNLANQRADIDAALTMGDKGIQIGDRAAFARQMAEVPNLMGLTAYHGTPHTIKGKFDISKVGTGEGAQAYGHGMYFAEAPDVAKTYMTVGGKGEFVRLGDKVLPTASQEGQLLSDVTKLGRKAAINKYPDQADYIKTINPDNIQFEGGNLYKVDIPDEYIPNMLDWDKPLSQQPKAVQEALAKYDPDSFSPKGMDYDPNERGQWIYMRLAGDTTQKNASNKLNEFGIKGIKYNDAGSRDAKGGTSNFVVFDPSTVKILEQNSKPMTRKEIIEQELEKVSK